MPSPFDTGIRLIVTPDPHRVRCDVDEFVLCPTNARADEAERALAKVADLMRCVPDDHDDLVEAVRLLVEERDRLRSERDHYREVAERDAARRTLHRIMATMAYKPESDDDLDEAVRLLIAERDAARAEVERLRGLLARVETWAQTYGAALKPSGADTYGEGMRVAKWQVSNLIREGGLTDE